MFFSGGSWHRPASTHAALLDKYWTKLQIGNMPREELKQASVADLVRETAELLVSIRRHFMYY